ncbi:MAG TPA: exopolysaccharide biosynthesis protein [Hyphomicrobiales bacterium]|nr:exopolysaccharide biosynthesis protein [Hyphomicrobiales bacterium]
MDMPRPEEAEPQNRPVRTSEIIARLESKVDDTGRISVGAIIDTLYDRSFGVVIILFALPNTIFPLAFVLGTPILIFTVQMIMGRQRPWLPEIMRRQTIDGRTFSKIVGYTVKYLSRIERWLKPRWNFLTTNPMERFIGFLLTIFTLILMVPVVPFGNALPSFGIAIIAAGLLEKDGAAIAVGTLVSLAGTVYVVSFVGGLLAAARAIFGF